MRAHLPHVGSRYGAPMGRVDSLPATFAGTVRVARIPINRGGYDQGGAYWGLQRQPLYQARGEGAAFYFLADDRPDALATAADHFPLATVRA